MPAVVRTGLESLLDAPPPALRGARAGLLTNPSGVTRQLRHAAEAIAEVASFDLVALFGPEHGVRGEAQAGRHVASTSDPRTGLPVHSLYGEDRAPSAAMLAGIDVLLIDIQDIGVRYATYASTVFAAMDAAADHAVAIVVLDRPNPISGAAVQGNLLQPDLRSFVGAHLVPIRHGLTLGELARLYARDTALPEPLIVAMEGWRRAMWFDETGLPWVLPSPNLPTLDSLTLYPATCLVEGTNLSEGRGTTRPFELVGAPWINPEALAVNLHRRSVPGVAFRPVSFVPMFSKHAGQRCGGVQVHLVDRQALNAPAFGVELLAALRAVAPDRFSWNPPADDTSPFFIDLLAGTAELRHTVDAGAPMADLIAGWEAEAASFQTRHAAAALYT